MNRTFEGCKNLTSVTFEGQIDLSIGPNSPFPGDLVDKYFASDGGPGTYKRSTGGNVWRKQ